MVAGLVIHRPVAGFRVVRREGEPVPGVGEPLLKLSIRTEREAAAKSCESDHNLRCIDDNSLNRSSINDLCCEGVKGHLVVGGEAVEIVTSSCSGGSFTVHDIGALGVGDEAVEMPAQQVGLAGRGA